VELRGYGGFRPYVLSSSFYSLAGELQPSPVKGRQRVKSGSTRHLVYHRKGLSTHSLDFAEKIKDVTQMEGLG
jgi:hypothetical protein